MASALYDSYTFYQGLQSSRKELSSQMYDFGALLGFRLVPLGQMTGRRNCRAKRASSQQETLKPFKMEL